jgi:hypothetical protein
MAVRCPLEFRQAYAVLQKEHDGSNLPRCVGICIRSISFLEYVIILASYRRDVILNMLYGTVLQWLDREASYHITTIEWTPFCTTARQIRPSRRLLRRVSAGMGYIADPIDRIGSSFHEKGLEKPVSEMSITGIDMK